jgi:serine/threonine protein phosphatase PrpC/TolA-binding protein
MELKAGVVCDRGLNPRRPVNQDRFLSIPEHGLFAVFDGVGGQKAGEVASQTAADTIEEALEHNSGSLSPESVRRAVEFANRDIYELADSNPSYKTMATTVALLQIDGNRATIAHAGDSRVYRLEKGKLYRETIDHTDLDDALRSGVITEEQAAGFEESHVINRALGMGPQVDVELKTVKIHEGSKFLLCTDGVYRLVTDEEITSLLAETADPQKIAGDIKTLVHSRGADDNLTAVVVQAGRAGTRTRAKGAAASGTGPSGGRKEPNQELGFGVPGVGASMAESARSRRDQEAFSSRIRVDLQGQATAETVVDASKKAATYQGADQKPRTSVYIIYCLVGVALLLAAFYAGLKVSDWKLKSRAAAAAKDRAADPLEAARGQFQRGDYPAAAAAFSAIVQQQPQNAQAHYWLGRSELAQRQFADAARSFEQAATLQPDMTNAFVEAAGAYEAAGNRTRAVEMLQRYKEELGH